MATALHPIPIDVPLPPGVHVGAVVAYRDYPDVTTLSNVNPRHTTPTGETIVFCGCGHEAGTRSGGGLCARWCAARCGCELHDTPRSH